MAPTTPSSIVTIIAAPELRYPLDEQGSLVGTSTFEANATALDGTELTDPDISEETSAICESRHSILPSQVGGISATEGTDWVGPLYKDDFRNAVRKYTGDVRCASDSSVMTTVSLISLDQKDAITTGNGTDPNLLSREIVAASSAKCFTDRDVIIKHYSDSQHGGISVSFTGVEQSGTETKLNKSQSSATVPNSSLTATDVHYPVTAQNLLHLPGHRRTRGPNRALRVQKWCERSEHSDENEPGPARTISDYDTPK